MRKRIAPLLVCLLFMIASETPLHAWPWGPETVTIINGSTFTTEDVESWWQNWQEKETPFPDSATEYENWQLMAQEALSMELDREPSFRHKVDVFLKARTLLVYRGEVIDSHINITEKQLWERYVENYTPRLRVNILYFNDRGQADAAYRSLASVKEVQDFGVLAGEMNIANKDSVFYEEKIFRPSREPAAWKPVLAELDPGAFSPVFAWSKGFVLLQLEGRLGPEKEDFITVSKKIEKELYDNQVASLTGKLVEQLKQSYNVEVNEAIFAAIEIDGDNTALADQTIMTLAGMDISTAMFLAKLSKENQFRTQYGFQEEDPHKMKRRVLDGIIAQTLTSRAALDRHYEEKPPLRPVYNFYRQHRLIKELGKRLFAAEIVVTEEEIQSYYDKNKGDFSLSDTLSFAVIRDEKKLIDRISSAIMQGGDFFAESARYYSREVEVQRLPEENIDADTRALLGTMAPGEVSRPIADGAMYKIIKFIKRTSEKAVPIDHVKEMIGEILKKEKRDTIQGDFLALLRDRSSIETSQKVWAALHKKLGEPDESSAR